MSNGVWVQEDRVFCSHLCDLRGVRREGRVVDRRSEKHGLTSYEVPFRFLWNMVRQQAFHMILEKQKKAFQINGGDVPSFCKATCFRLKQPCVSTLLETIDQEYRYETPASPALRISPPSRRPPVFGAGKWL